MTLRDLREMVAAMDGDGAPETAEIKVWLPGSRITLTAGWIPRPGDNLLLIEGNLDDGSALAR